MFTFRMETPSLTKAVTDGLKAIAIQLEIGNQLKAKEVLVQEELLRLLRRQCRPARPTGLVHQLVRETEGMADILTYSVNCDAPADPDVESRKIKVEVNGEVKREDTVGSAVTDFGYVEVEQNANVKISISDVDDGGNESAPLVAEFVAVDTIAPPTPTGMQVVLTAEREAPPAETPPAEEPPATPVEENFDPVTPQDPPPAEEPPAPPAE